jgi:pyruvoyl-dependent arginine decarboxylase (PvlArgDC)
MTTTTLPSTETTTSLPAMNAMRHGILSAHLLLQWEDASEYHTLLTEMQQEYSPATVTEAHLVEELAGIMWRKRRLHMAEAAHYQKSIESNLTDNHTAVAALACIITETTPRKFNRQKALANTEEQNQRELDAISILLEPARKAFTILERGGAYEQAIEMFAAVTLAWWNDALNGQTNSYTPYKPDAESLMRFLKREVLPDYVLRYEDVTYRPLVKRQAEGEAFMPSEKLEKFTRYEVQLDRKFERTLTVLLRLQEMRRNKAEILQSKIGGSGLIE